MWGRRRETQAEAADAAAQSQAPISAAVPAGGTAPETETSPSLGEESSRPCRRGSRGSNDAPPILDEKAQQFWRGKLAAANLANAVALFLRSPAHRHYTLADLEWCLLPALALNQFMAAEVKLPDGQAMPVALVLWARVSAEVDARLTAAPRYPIRLHLNEWQSGDVFWIIDAVGERNAVQQCIEALAKTVFKGNQIKVLSPAPFIRENTV